MLARLNSEWMDDPSGISLSLTLLTEAALFSLASEVHIYCDLNMLLFDAILV